MSDPRPEQFLTVEQIAEELQVTSQTIRNWIKAGALRALRVGHVYRIRREELEAMIARQQGESRELGSHRDPWAPESLGLPYKGREGVRPPSVWEGMGTPIAASDES